MKKSMKKSIVALPYRRRLVATFVLPLVVWLLDGAARAQLPAVVFVSRDLTTAPDPAKRIHAIERAASGRLLVLEPDGATRVLVDASAPGAPEGAPVDVADPDVLFDGSRILFAGYSVTESAWRIYEIGADGDGLRQITRSDRGVDVSRYGEAGELLRNYDDVDPVYLPDGRVCFVSTHYPGIAPDGRLRSNNLYVMNADGSNINRITSERFGADTPVVEPATGRIVYSRFWRTAPFARGEAQGAPAPIVPGSPAYENIVFEPSDLPLRGVREEEFPGVNSWFLAGINPDGTDLAMWSGFRLDRELTQAYRPSFLPSGEALAVFLPVTPFLGFPRGYGLRRFQQGPGKPVALGGPQVFPRRFGVPPAVNYTYVSAEALPDGRLLVTAVPAEEGNLDYAIYVQENDRTQPNLLHNDANSMELDAMPLVARAVPPVVADTVTEVMPEESALTPEEAFNLGGSFTFLCENIYFNGPVDSATANAPPVGKRLSIEFYLNSQRTSPTGGDRPTLLDSVELPPSGRIVAIAPAGQPLFELLRRPDGSVAMGRDGQIFHVAGANFGRVGTEARCVGCHAGHTQIAVPEDPSWTNLAPSATVRASSRRLRDRTELEDFREANLVDRQTGRPFVEWAAENGVPASTVELRWSVPLRGRELVIYGTSQGEGSVGTRSQVIQSLGVSTFLRGEKQQELRVTETIQPEGTKVALNPELEFDKVVLTIESEDVNGLYEGQAGTALAEIEVISKAAGLPTLSFVRGDADCDVDVELTDAVVILSSLFIDGSPLCCRAATDADQDGDVNISDPIYILNFLFLGGGQIAEPFGECGTVPAGDLLCDADFCP